jgi:hypothetical protein
LIFKRSGMAKEYQTQAAKLGGSTSPQLAMVATSQGSDHVYERGVSD